MVKFCVVHEQVEFVLLVLGQANSNSLYKNKKSWGIEGTLHWHLDVTLGEDKSKTKNGNAPENLNIKYNTKSDSTNTKTNRRKTK